MSPADARRCPYCLADLVPREDPVVECAKCATPHHEACFAEHGQCTVFGCGGEETTSEGERAPRGPGSLHPFLPLGKQVIRRNASFLSVTGPERDRKKRRGERPYLELDLPAVAICGQQTEGRLSAFVGRYSVKGSGVRLRVRSLLLERGQAITLSDEEAVVVGRPSEGWTKRLKLFSRKEPPAVLLGPGKSDFTFSFDPSRLAWRGALPGTGRGPRQDLEVTVEVDGAIKLEATHRMRLLDGRPAPPSLPEAAHLDLTAPVEAIPLRADEPAEWRACPLVAGSVKAARLLPVAMLALKHELTLAEEQPATDGLDLSIEPLDPKSSVLRGSLTLALRRKELKGRVVIELITDRKQPKDREFRTYVREAAVLYDGSDPDQDVSGQHAKSFEYVLPPAFRRAKLHDRRRLTVQASLLGEGRPLRSVERHVLVRPPKRRRRPRRRS